jgi:hypothetical protein
MKKVPLSPKMKALLKAIREKLARDQTDPTNHLTSQEAVMLAYEKECTVAFSDDFNLFRDIRPGSLLISPSHITIVCHRLEKGYEWPYPEDVLREAVCEDHSLALGHLRGSRIIMNGHMRVICSRKRIVAETALAKIINQWHVPLDMSGAG